MAKWMCETCGTPLPGNAKAMTSYHAGRVTHAVRAVPRVAQSGGRSNSSTVRPRTQQTPHGFLAWISATALVVGLIASSVWHEDEYCHRNPDSGPNMRVDRHCYEVLAESSTWEAMMGKIGSWLILGSIVGFLVALWWYFRHHVREQ